MLNNMTKTFPICLLVGWHIVTMIASSTASAEIISDFSTGADGWWVVDINHKPLTNPPEIVATYPNTDWDGGCIWTGDFTGNATYFSAPAKFLGDQSTAFGTQFSYDMMVFGQIREHSIDLLLVGGEMTLIGDSGTPSLGPVWGTLEISLVGSSFVLNAVDGGPATDDNVRSVLANLTGLYILADHGPEYEYTYLDNVKLIPEPSTIAVLSSLGLCAIIGLGWRRRRKA